MISKLLNALLTPKFPRGYTGRHRAEFILVIMARPGLAWAKALFGRQATV
jgi:hypothetical protein